MASPVRQYTDEVHKAFSYWATWLPNAAVSVGDCGPVKDRVFSPEATLEDFGIQFESMRGDKPMDIQYASADGVDYTIQLAAGNQVIPQIPQGNAGIEISFSRENAVVLVVRKGYQHRIENIHALRGALLASNDFPRDYAVVTEAVAAGSATVLISSGSDAKFAASAKADLKAGLAELANAKLAFARVAAKKLQTEIVASKGLTPLFRLVGFKRDGWFWGSPRVADLGFEDDAAPGDVGAVEPTDTDSES